MTPNKEDPKGLPKPLSDIISQLRVEYDYAFQYMNPKRVQVLDRLRLFSNQTRDPALVGDTTLFTIFQTVLTKLYDDQLSVNFSPGHPDDTDKVDALSPVASYDNIKMDKDQYDYDLDWYTLFWGAGFGDLSEFDSKKKILNPSVMDNATFLLDPDCTLINGDKRGFGAARFWGREIAKTKDAMKKEGFSNYDNLAPAPDASSLAYYDKSVRRTAQNLGASPAPSNYENELIPLLEWHTHINGEKWIITSDLKFSNIVKSRKETFQDKWPLEHRKLFPIPGDPFGVSVPDLIEDKQRAKAILINLGLMHAKADLYPMYIYDRNLISPTTDLSFSFNKWIPADGNPQEAAQALPKRDPGTVVSFIMQTIDQAAQRATAAESMQQGDTTDSSRSANEVVRVFNSAEARLSTSAKIFGWSEREFWYFWLRTYNRFFTEAHSKFIRIDGPFGPEFEKITGDNFQFEEDPDIFIESKVLSDAKNQDAKNDFIGFTNIIAQDQTVNRRYWNKKGAKLFGNDSSEVNRIFPETPDELQAEMENKSLDKNKLVKININDDHNTHLLIHAKCDDTKAAIIHIEAHKKAIMIQRDMQQQQQAAQGQQQLPPGSQPMSQANTPNQQNQGSAPAANTQSGNAVQ